MNEDALSVVDEEEFPETGTPSGKALTHTLLEVWTGVLSNIERSEQERITLSTAVRLLNKHADLQMRELPRYFQRYHELLRELRWVVSEEVEAAGEEAFRRVEHDAEDNYAHYFNILVNWMKLANGWELMWDVSIPYANAEGAAIIDAYEFALGERGLAAQLDAIGFDWSDEFAAKLQLAVEAE